LHTETDVKLTRIKTHANFHYI